MLSKPDFFQWGWNNNDLLEDKLMNRDRAAKLLRSWRSGMRPANYRPLLSVKRIGLGTYRVQHECGESATLRVVSNPHRSTL